MPKLSIKNLTDQWLGKIEVNRKPVSWHRLQWWLVIILTRLFGRNVEIEGAGGKTLRLLPVIWGKKVHLLGSEHDFLQIDFTSQYTLRIKSGAAIPLTGGAPIQPDPSRRDSAAHVVLCHLSAPQTESILRHLRELGKAYHIVLAYGGKADEFSAIDYEHKVFIPDLSLRGLSYRLSYYDLIERVGAFLPSAGIDPEWIFISDFDLVPLREAYLSEPISLMKSHAAGFGAKLVRDVSLSNHFFVTNALTEGILDRMPSINGVGRSPLYHCLGSAVFFHRACFDQMGEFREALDGMNFELTLPTMAALKGFRVLSFDACSDLFRKVRHRPVFSSAEAMAVADEGYAFVHPVKEAAELLTHLQRKRALPFKPGDAPR